MKLIKIIKIIFIGMIFWGYGLGYAQKSTEQKQLLKEFYKIDSIVHQQFESSKIHRYSEKEFEELIKLYLKELELLEKIAGEERLKFITYKFRGGDLMRLDLLKEANESMELSYIHFYKIKGELDQNIILHGYLGYVDLAKNYTRLNEMDKATKHYKNALDFTRKYYSKIAHEATALNNLGIHFSENLHQKDSALIYFAKAKKIVENISDKRIRTLLGSIRDNVALIYLDEGKYKEAKDLFIKNYEFYIPKNYALEPDYERWLRAGMQIGETHLKLGEIAEAEKVFADVYSKLKRYNFNDKSSIQIRYFAAMELLHTLKRNHKEAYEYAHFKKDLTDSIRGNKNNEIETWNIQLQNISLNKIKTALKNEQLLIARNEEKKRFQLWMFIGVLSFAALSLMFYFIRSKQQLKYEEKEKNLEAQRTELLHLNSELLNEDLALKKSDLSSVVEELSENQKWIKKLLEKVKQIKRLEGKNRRDALTILEQEVTVYLNNKKNRKGFEERIATLSKEEFYIKLQQQFPNLTEAEIKTCAMIRLGIGNNELANLLNINTSSVYQNKYRLKKKMKIEGNLDEFLQAL